MVGFLFAKPCLRDKLGHAPTRQSNPQNRRGCQISKRLSSGYRRKRSFPPYTRKPKNSCGTVDWRSGQPARLPTSFLELFSCRSRKKCIVSPRQRVCNPSVGEKANRPPWQRVLQSFCRKANPPPLAKGFRPAPQEKKEKIALGAPTVKQFYIKTQKRRDFLVPFAHDLACKV